MLRSSSRAGYAATFVAFALLLGSASAQTLIPPSGAGGGAPSGVAGGDLSGTYPNPTVAAAAGNFTVGGNATVNGLLSAGVAGSAVGQLRFFNATSGLVRLQPPTGALGNVTLTLPAVTDTLIGKATADTLTNKTFDTTFSTGNSFSINGTLITTTVGTGPVVLGTSPTLTTPVLGVAAGTTLSLTGTGAIPVATTTQLYGWVNANGLQPTQSFVDSARTANNRIVEWDWVSGVLHGRFVNDAESAATDFMAVTGGQAAGITSVAITGHQVTAGPTPTCGTGCSSLTGNDNAFVVTTGAAQTSITVNFGGTGATAWTANPVCNVSSNSTASVTDIASVSTSAVTFGASVALTGALLYVNCRQ